jgi:hypothetical protein
MFGMTSLKVLQFSAVLSFIAAHYTRLLSKTQCSATTHPPQNPPAVTVRRVPG